jgi:hypothetical protein
MAFRADVAESVLYESVLEEEAQELAIVAQE